MARSIKQAIQKKQAQRHPFAYAFSPRRMAQPDFATRKPPALLPVVRAELTPRSRIEEKDDVSIRLTPQGQRLAKRLAAETPRQREMTMRLIQEHVRQAKKELGDQRKRIILDILRDEGKPEGGSDEHCEGAVRLEKICRILGVTPIEATLLLHEINGNRLDVPDDEPCAHAFFNCGTGEVWVELWEPEPGEHAR